jgi:hypothetical protein
VRPARKSTSRRGISVRLLRVLGLTTATIIVAPVGAQPVAAAPPSALQACAAVVADAERLACYDRLAGRVMPSVAAQGVQAPAPAATASPSPAAPAAAGAASTAPAPAPAPAALAPSPKESFGSYQLEHPKPQVVAAKSLEAHVVALGRSQGGYVTVSLEGGAIWELDEEDPLLAVGQSVTITRAALGSYILRTPSQRTHRVRRLH